MKDYPQKTVWVNVEFIRMTDRAILIRDLKGQPVWVPQSHILDQEDDFEDLESGMATGFEIKEWVAIEKDLI